MHLGHSVDGAAAMQVLATDVPVGDDVVAALRAVPGIVSVHLPRHRLTALRSAYDVHSTVTPERKRAGQRLAGRRPSAAAAAGVS